MAELVLKKGRERSVLRRHPWVFSGAVEAVCGEPAAGETVEILSHSREWLARAGYSPQSQLRARIWTWVAGEAVDPALFRRRLEASIAARERLGRAGRVNAYREVHAESDALPGVVVDRYGDFRVLQILSAGAEFWRQAILEALAGRGDCLGIYERSDADVRTLEGLPARSGPVWGRAPPPELVIEEDGLRYLVDIAAGQKTGFYLDQRETRGLLRRLAAESDVLNGFCYTGSFAVAALAGGARRVLSIDSSASALEVARRNLPLNSLPADRCDWVEADVFTELRRLRDRRRDFDLVVLDPPRLAVTSAQVHKAARAYKDINLLGLKLLRPGGLLVTFSCSGGVEPELFQRILAGAAQDAGIDARIVGWLGQPEDHPVALSFPEGRYLKGLVCRRAS